MQRAQIRRDFADDYEALPNGADFNEFVEVRDSGASEVDTSTIRPCSTLCVTWIRCRISLDIAKPVTSQSDEQRAQFEAAWASVVNDSEVIFLGGKNRLHFDVINDLERFGKRWRNNNNCLQKIVSCQYADDPGVLIVSEFVGSAQSLGCGALLVNPWEIDDVSLALATALEMGAGAAPDAAGGAVQDHQQEHGAKPSSTRCTSRSQSIRRTRPSGPRPPTSSASSAPFCRASAG